MKRKLTEEQCRLVEENRGLVCYVLHLRFWGVSNADWEDYVQIGMIGLCHAAVGWEPAKGIFSTYACRCIERQVRTWVRDQRAVCRDRRKEAYSLDAIVPGGEKPTTFGELIPAEETVEDMLDVLIVREAMAKLKGRDKQMLDLLLEGKTQTQIGDALNLSQGYVARCLQRIARQLREEVCA